MSINKIAIFTWDAMTEERKKKLKLLLKYVAIYR